MCCAGRGLPQHLAAAQASHVARQCWSTRLPRLARASAPHSQACSPPCTLLDTQGWPAQTRAHSLAGAVTDTGGIEPLHACTAGSSGMNQQSVRSMCPGRAAAMTHKAPTGIGNQLILAGSLFCCSRPALQEQSHEQVVMGGQTASSSIVAATAVARCGGSSSAGSSGGQASQNDQPGMSLAGTQKGRQVQKRSSPAPLSL